jgi:hypothetical protein
MAGFASCLNKDPTTAASLSVTQCRVTTGALAAALNVQVVGCDPLTKNWVNQTW